MRLVPRSKFIARQAPHADVFGRRRTREESRLVGGALVCQAHRKPGVVDRLDRSRRRNIHYREFRRLHCMEERFSPMAGLIRCE